jgi:hypothetical protein
MPLQIAHLRSLQLSFYRGLDVVFYRADGEAKHHLDK